MLGFAAVYLRRLDVARCAADLGLGLLPAIALVDLHFGIMPDGLNLLVAASGFVWIALGGDDFYTRSDPAAALLALGLFLALVYSRWRGKEMLGLGDVKFFAAAGLWLPLSLRRGFWPWRALSAPFSALSGAMPAAARNCLSRRPFVFRWRFAFSTSLWRCHSAL